MPWDEIKFKVSADMDFGNAINQVKTIKDGIGELKESISEMPNVTNLLNNSFDKTATITDELVSNIQKLQSGELSQAQREKYERRASSNVLELNALRDIQLGTTDFSDKVARTWFGNLPEAVKHQFDAMTPQLATLIRTRMSSLSQYGNGIKSTSPGAIAKILTGGTNPSKMDADLKRLTEKYHVGSEGLFQLDEFIKHLIPAITPMNRFSAYQKKRYGAISQSAKANLFSGNAVDLFPESYKGTFRSKGKEFNVFDNSHQSMVLETEYRKKLDALLRSNPIAVKAAIESGISRRDERGILETKQEIQRSQWENFRKSLYDDLLIRVSGYKSNSLNAYKAVGKDKQKLMSRLTSSSSGRAMLAMQDIEAMENPNAWVNGTGVDSWRKLPSEGKRMLDQHVVDKYSLFSPDAGLQFVNPRKVMISESHNTRLLGGNKWKNNQDVSDTISVVSLDGYDPSNPKHVKTLEGLFSDKGTRIGNSTYIAQSIHGTGKDTIVRMIEKSAYDRVNEQERAWITSHPDEAVRGIRGNYWEGFEDAEIERLKKEGITSKDWGKHLEMLNKPWTPTSELGLNIDGKRFAVVNTRGFGDGAAWFSSSVMPHSGQFRGGLGLKGSSFVFEGNGMRAFGKKTGLLDDQGRLMMEGPDGQLYDVSSYDGIIPLDVIKNKGILKDDNGNFVSGDIASRRMTAMLQRYPMSYHVDYDLEDKNSGHLGTQMASFMMLSPKVREHQIEMAMRVMNELDTEAGQIKHVFAGEDDYLSRKINESTDASALLVTDEARRRVDSKRASLINNIIAGQYTDFENDSSIANLRAAANPVAAILLAEEKRLAEAREAGDTSAIAGINANGVIAKARQYLERDAAEKKRLDQNYEAPVYTDQEIRDMIVLPEGKIVDFNRPDVKRVSIARSPTGFGNLYNAENLAEAALPIYKGFLGEQYSKAGVYVSEQDTERLQSMDFDADQVKAIYDQELAESIAETLKTMEYKKEDVQKRGVEFTPEQLRSRAIQSRSLAERNLAAPLGMGTGSSGIRVMQIDYSRPENRRLVEGARRAAGIYDIASTPKSGEVYEIGNEDPVWALLGLGKEFTKFSEGRSALFKFDDDMKDDQGNVIKDHKDVFRASNGQEINLRALRDMKIDEINLPSRYMANHLMAVSDIGQLYRHGLVDTTQMDAIYEAMNKELGYGDAGTASQQLMKAVRLLHTQFGTGERAYIANNEVAPLQDLIDSAEAEIALKLQDYFDPESGKYVKDGKVYQTKDALKTALETQYGVRTAKNALGNMGMLEQDLVDAYGEDYVRNNYVNSTDIFRRHEEDRATELNYREKENDVRIKELHAQDEQEKENNKRNGHKRNRKSVEQQALDKEIENTRKAIGLSKNTEIDDYEKAINEAIKNDEAWLDTLQDINGSEDQIKTVKESITNNRSKLEGINKYKNLVKRRADLDKTPTELALEEAYKEKEQIAQEKENNARLMDLRLEFQGTIGEAAEFNRGLYASRKGKENKIDESTTAARRYWNRGFYQNQEEYKILDDLSERIEASEFDNDTKSRMRTQISAVKEQMGDNFVIDFADNAILTAKNAAESITKELEAPSAKKQKLDNYKDIVKDLQGYADLMQEKIDKKVINDEQKKAYVDSINKVNNYINTINNAEQGLIEKYTKDNEKTATTAMESLQGKLGLRTSHSLEVQAQNRRDLIQERREAITKNHSEGLMSDAFYRKQMEMLDQYDTQANQNTIKDNRLRLGMDTVSPQEKANEWLKERLDVIDFQRQQAEVARKAYLDAEYDPQSTLAERTRKEETWKNADAALQELDEEEKRLREQAEARATVDAELRNIQQENARLSLIDQGDTRVRNMRHQFEQQNRQQRMRYSRSRIAQAIYSVEQRRDAKQQEIIGIEDQRRSVQRQQDYYAKELEFARKSGDEERINKAQFNYDQTTQQLNNLDKASKEAKDQLDQLNQGGQTAQAVFGAFGQTLSMVAARLGRQLFQKALQETKHFVKEFDASMTEIQAITLKSDQEMQGIRSQTINKALGLRTSVSNVSNVEAALYRQGLSDQEVSARTESIIKFATVTKLKVEDATKIITTALQNDLVTSANEAMDALVALGDSAATTAAEIGKGMQKAAAAAKVAGVSYSELTALLTIGTSDTQLSGTQVGTALQTVFTRMRRLSTTGWAADQNGEKTTANDAEAALKAVGVDLWDDKSVGKMRSAYEVLRDLSKVWQNLSDAQKNIVMNSMAGTRQTNVFATLMEGMSEDNGATLEKYLGLAEGSEGVTQSKYEIAMQSLAASMDTLKSSWDTVVESFVSSGSITGILDSVSGFLQGIANSSDIGKGFGVVTGGIAALVTALLTLKSANPIIAALSGLFALVAGVGAGGLITSLFGKPETDEDKMNNAIELTKGNIEGRSAVSSKQDSLIDAVKKSGERYDNAFKSDNIAEQAIATTELTKALEDLAVAFPTVSDEIQKSINNLQNWGKAVNEAQNVADDFVTESKRKSLDESFNNLSNYFATEYEKQSSYKVSAQKTARALEYIDRAGLGRFSKNEDLLAGFVSQYIVAQADAERGGENSKAFIDTVDYVFTQLGYGDTILKKLKNKDTTGYDADQVANAFGSVVTYLNSDTAKSNTSKMIAGRADVQNVIRTFIDSSLFTESGISGDKILNAYLSWLNEEMAQNPTIYYDENGNVNWQEILNHYAVNLKNPYYNLENSDQRQKWIKDFIQTRSSYTNYNFHYNENDPNTWFDDYNEAIEYGSKHGLDLTTLKTSNGSSAYQGFEALFEARNIEANANNVNDVIDEILHGSKIDISKIGEDYQKKIAHAYATSINANEEEILNKIKSGEITYNNLSPFLQNIVSGIPSLGVEGLSEYPDLQSLYHAYNTAGKSSVLTNFVANNANAASAVLMGDMDMFTKAVQEAEQGMSTTSSRADMMRTFGTAFQTGEATNRAEAVKLFRTNGLTSKAYETWQSFFGENADAILTAMASEEGLTGDLLDYYNKTLAEKGIAIGTGKQFTGVETSRLAQTVLGIGDWTKAQETSSRRGWTSDEWSAIENKYPDLKRYLQMTDEQRASQEGQNLKRNLNIQFNIAGISDLEEAGKVAAGTTENIEKLQKNGKIALEVTLDYQVNGFAQGQKSAQFYNGTKQQRDAIIMAATGVTREQLYASNESYNYYSNQTEKNLQADEDLQMAGLWEVYKKADPMQRAELRRAAEIMGYQMNLKGYTKTGTPELSNVGSLVGEAQTYTDLEKAQALQDIISGRMIRTTGENGNSELYDAAIANSGTYTRLYEWQKQNNIKPSDELTRLAAQEAAELVKNATEREALEKARLGSGSLTGMFSYQQVQREQQNKGVYAADKIFASLDSTKIKNFDDLMNVFNGSQSDNWKDLLESSPELAKKLSDIGVKIGENGLDFSAVESSGYELVDVLDMLKASVAGASDEFNKFAKVESVGDKYNKAMAFLSGEEVIDEEAGYEALKEIYGNEAIAQTVYNNRPVDGLWLDQGDYFENGNAYDSHGNLIGTKEEYLNRAASIYGYNKYEGLEGYDLAYAQQLEENAKYGQTGLTDINRINFFEQLLEDARNGNLANIREADKTGFYSDVTGVVSGGSNYLQMVETLQKNGLDYTNFANVEEGSEAYKQLQEAFEGTGHTAEEFLESQKQIDIELKGASITALRTYGKESEKVADTYKKLNGTVEDQLNVQKQINKNRLALGNATYYTSGKGSKDYKKVAEQFLGYSKKDIEGLQKSLGKEGAKLKIQEEAELQLSFNRQQVINDVNTTLQDTIDEIGGLEGVNVPFEIDGTYSIDQLKAMQEEATGKAKAIIDALLQSLAGMEGSVTFEASEDGKTIKVGSSDIKTTGGGYRTGGGGGGGKSATDKLIEAQKRKLAELEHQQKMLEIAEKGLDFSNDYSSWNSNLDDQVVVQEKLRAQYAANIKEMDDMLKKVKQGSDDWYKLKETIMSAEEAMASVNNTINEINEKRISILEQQQENEDKPDAHRLSMQKKYAARYQTSDQFEGYVAMTEADIETTKQQIEMNNEQIKAWEDMLLQFEEGEDGWLKVRDNIWKIKEENADLENDVASQMIDLEEAKIAQIAKDLENEQSPYQHSINMLETYGGMYQSMNNQGAYRGTLQDTIANNNQLKMLNDAAIEELKNQIEGMQESDPARQSAISTLYRLEETSAKYEASMLANQQAIEESLISELKTNYSDSGSILEHEMKLLSEAEKEFLRDDDFANYENILQEETRNTSERIELQKKALEDYLALQNSGQITEGSPQWKELETSIREAEESLAAYSNEYEELLDKAQNARFENLQKTFNETDALSQHNLKMIQYEETRYQNRGELTNYGTLLRQDTEMQTARAGEISAYIEELKSMQETVQDNPTLYKKITEEIYKWEESLSTVNNTIEKNEQLLHKNEEAIRKVRKAVEDTIDKEIRARIQKERDMLAATVQVENSILDVIRKNKQEEWNLEKKTIDLKKQSLNEEKNLINERLNARKDAVNKEQKYEELAEYKRQLALISADTTRTKDANELRKKIKDLEQDIAWDVADDVTNASLQAIDDQIKAMDSYVSTYEEDLNEMLSDANNFRDQIDQVMGGSFEDFLSWMQENNESYKLATAEARTTMEQGWEDTWKKMKGEIDTYWNEVDESMRSKEGFLAYMQNSDTYKTASETGQQSLLSYWSDMYDDYTNSLIDNAEFDHTHEIIDKVDELKDWTFNVRLSDLADYDMGSWSDYIYNRRTDYDPYVEDDDYSGKGKQPEPSPTPEPTPAPSGGGKKTTSPSIAEEKYWVYGYNANGEHQRFTPEYDSADAATSVAKRSIANGWYNLYVVNKKTGKKIGNIINPKFSASETAKFAEGGLVDFTGPAWVDGTKTKPESFLDSTDTALLRSMLDTFTYIKNTPYMSHIDTSNYGKPAINVGDVNVNLYEAKLENDADYDKIAAKVGQAFTKELQKEGLNLANYAW